MSVPFGPVSKDKLSSSSDYSGQAGASSRISVESLLSHNGVRANFDPIKRPSFLYDHESLELIKEKYFLRLLCIYFLKIYMQNLQGKSC